MQGVRLGRYRLSITSTWLVPVVLTAVLLVILSAAAAAALETNTVGSFRRGLWWALSLITTVGFIGEPPETPAGAVLSSVLMVAGFALLAMVSAALAALFVREEEQEPTATLEALSREILARVQSLEERIALLEDRVSQMGDRPEPPVP